MVMVMLMQKVIVMMGHGGGDARCTGATGRRLVPLRPSTYLPLRSTSPVPPLFSPPVTRETSIAVALTIAHPAGASPVLQR